MSEFEVITKKRRIEGESVVPATIVDLNLKLLKEQRDCDLYFIVGREREKIGAHKAILKARSSYFDVRLSGRWGNESNPEDKTSNNEIVLEDIEPSIFLPFLEHIYAYVLNIVRPVEAVKLLHMAEYYGVPSLVKMCEEILEKPLQLDDDILEVFVPAQKFQLTNVVSKAGKTMANYFTQLANLPSFEKANEATLIYLLKRDDLNVDESKLFSILLRWADKQIENSTKDPKPGRSQILKNLIPFVRFPTMSANYFAEVVAPMSILPLESKCRLLMYFNSGEEKRKELASKFPFSTAPRKNAMVSVDLYKPKVGPMWESSAALKKCSYVVDVLSFSRWGTSLKIQIVSLVLEPPKYSASLFKNSSEVAELNLPIKVAISLTETDTRNSRLTWQSEEVFACLESRQIVLMLEKPWILSLNKFYIITVRFLSEVYTVPEVIGDGNQSHHRSGRRKENFDFFTSTKLLSSIDLPLRRIAMIDSLSMSGCSVSAAGGLPGEAASMNISSGLHLLRSIQVTDV